MEREKTANSPGAIDTATGLTASQIMKNSGGSWSSSQEGSTETSDLNGRSDNLSASSSPTSSVVLANKLIGFKESKEADATAATNTIKKSAIQAVSSDKESLASTIFRCAVPVQCPADFFQQPSHQQPNHHHDKECSKYRKSHHHRRDDEDEFSFHSSLVEDCETVSSTSHTSENVNRLVDARLTTSNNSNSLLASIRSISTLSPTADLELNTPEIRAAANQRRPVFPLPTTKMVSVDAGAHYRVPTHLHFLQKVGSGAYGVVAAFYNKLTGRPVAVKKVTKAFNDLVDARRILREIRILRQLNHPNILK